MRPFRQGTHEVLRRETMSGTAHAGDTSTRNSWKSGDKTVGTALAGARGVGGLNHVACNDAGADAMACKAVYGIVQHAGKTLEALAEK